MKKNNKYKSKNESINKCDNFVGNCHIEFKWLTRKMNEYEKRYNDTIDLVNYIIGTNSKDIHLISVAFTEIILLYYEEFSETLFYTLFSYTKNFDERLAYDYKKIYLEKNKEAIKKERMRYEGEC